MKILGIDTTGSYCSVALVDDASILSHKSENIGRGHAERLAPMVDEVFVKAGLTAKEIDRICVCVGPGSFTGIRVGLAFAKGFALPRNIPVIGINALEVSAHLTRVTLNDDLVGVYRDIRRGEVFYGSYRRGEPLEPPRSLTLQDAQHQANRLQARLIESKQPNTPILAWLGADRNPSDYPAAPLYSRPPDAKLPGGRDVV